MCMNTRKGGGIVKLQELQVASVYEFIYLGSTNQSKGKRQGGIGREE